MTETAATEVDDRDVTDPDGIDWAVRATGKDTSRPSVLYVPHINARTAALKLDDWVGPFNWRESYSMIQVGKHLGVQCVLEIRGPFEHRTGLTAAGGTEPLGEWIPKIGWAEVDESGTPEMIVKGAESTAFKRAATKAGIGRNVHRIEGVWGPGEVSTSNKKIYAVKSVTLNDGEILTINQWCARRAGLVEGATV